MNQLNESPEETGTFFWILITGLHFNDEYLLFIIYWNPHINFSTFTRNSINQ